MQKGVGENDKLRPGAEFIDECFGAFERFEGVDDGLDVAEFEIVCRQQIEAIAHQHIVIRLIARGAAQGLDAGFLGNGNPDFRHQNAFQIQGDNRLFHGRVDSEHGE